MPAASVAYEGSVRTTVDGLSMGGYAAHGEYLRELRAGRKEALAARLFQAAVRPGGVAVDGGAYIGYYTLLAARMAGARGLVISFEPHPLAFRSLRTNLAANGLSDRVLARPECLGERVGIRRFHLAGGDGSKSSMFEPERSTGSPAVGCTSLDAVLEDGPGVDAMKLDLEGGEVEALRGMRRTLARSPRITLIIEYNPRALRRAGFPPRALLAELDRTGLEARVIDEHRGRLGELAEADTLAAAPEAAGHVNLYCGAPLAPEPGRAARRRSRARLDRPTGRADVPPDRG